MPAPLWDNNHIFSVYMYVILLLVMSSAVLHTFTYIFIIKDSTMNKNENLSFGYVIIIRVYFHLDPLMLQKGRPEYIKQ